MDLNTHAQDTRARNLERAAFQIFWVIQAKQTQRWYIDKLIQC